VDEGLRLAKQVDPAAIRNSADVLIVKSIPQGGVRNSLSVISEVGLPVIISGSLDTSIGLVSGLQLAGSVPDLAGACGLGTGLLFAQDLVKPQTLPRNGEITISHPSPDPDLLELATTSVSSDDQQLWQERMVRAWYASGSRLVSDIVRQAVEKW
jgi:O-succinylbenzoate synthase